MKKLKIVKLFVIIFLLIGTGLNSLVIGQEINEEENNDVFIDPTIKLTRKHLPKLKSFLNGVENKEIEYFIEEILDRIELNDIVDSNDVEEIINEIDDNISSILFLPMGGCGCENYGGVKLGPLAHIIWRLSLSATGFFGLYIGYSNYLIFDYANYFFFPFLKGVEQCDMLYIIGISGIILTTIMMFPNCENYSYGSNNFFIGAGLLAITIDY